MIYIYKKKSRGFTSKYNLNLVDGIRMSFISLQFTLFKNPPPLQIIHSFMYICTPYVLYTSIRLYVRDFRCNENITVPVIVTCRHDDVSH